MSSTDTYLTSDDVAARLQVVPKTVRKLVATQGLPAFRVGKRLRFVETEVDAWIAARSGSAPADTAAPTPETDAYRAEIIRLVDSAPTLTAAQTDIIRAVLGGFPVAASRR